jgi:hypothetical protein
MSFFIGDGSNGAARASIIETGCNWDAKAHGDAIRHGLHESVYDATLCRATESREAGIFVCYKRSTCGARSREWSHEDAAFLAILFQASFYVLPEKA